MKQICCAIAFIILSAGYMLTPGFAAAAPLKLGAPFGVVRAAFANAKEIHSASQRVLEVITPHFAGVVWRKADFAFDGTDHLKFVTLSTTGYSFAQIENLMAAALAQVDAAPPGQEGLAQDVQGDVQIRICEGDKGEITVTFERTAI